MKALGVGVMCLAMNLTASHVIAQTVGARDLEQFLEQYSDSVQAGDSADWKYLLYVAAVDGGAPEAVTARFAERIGVSNATARDYASIILETSVLEERCGTDVRGRRPADCVFAPGQRRYDRAASLARGERSGQLLIAVARSGAMTMEDEAALVALIRTHPAAPAIFARLFERQRNSAFLLALAASGPLPERLSLLAATSALSYHRWSRQDDARRLALLESVEASAVRNKSSARTRAALAQIGLWWKLEIGLIDEAVASYYAYPADVRALLPIPDGCLDTVERCFQIDRYRLSDELAAALWLSGHTDDARRLLRQAIPNFSSRLPAAETRYRALSDAVSPSYSADDLFPLFVDGALPNQPEKPDGRIGIQAFNGNGWVFVARGAGPAVRRVIAGRLRTAGYGSMAAYLELPDRPMRSDAVDAVLQAVAGMFPRSLNGRQTHWRARIDAAAAPQRTSGTPEPVTVVTRRPQAWWTERRLPASTTPWRDTDVKQAPPDDADLPVDRDAVVRYEERNGEQAIIYLSTEYELPYLTRTAGIWFARTVRGVWSPPLYLGLQQHFPYVVTPNSRLPLLDGQRLRIEVQVREIDAAAFGYPLVSVLKRSAEGLYLDVDLTAVAADRDGDGLTDIAEWRIGLDFTRADTDGDGVVDGRDPLPLVAYRSAAATDQLARAIVTTIFSDEPGPIVVGVAPTLREMTTGNQRDEAARTRARTRFLIGDPSMFAGLATSFPLIVYSRADIASLDRGGARRYPAQVTHIFSSLDGRTHHVSWSAAGTGGSFVVTCDTPGDACSVKTTSMWIT